MGYTLCVKYPSLNRFFADNESKILHLMFKLIVILIAYELLKWAIKKLFDKIVNND
jgi:hypothetical protein